MDVNLSHLEEQNFIVVQQFFKKIIRSQTTILVILEVKEMKTQDILRSITKDVEDIMGRYYDYIVGFAWVLNTT